MFCGKTRQRLVERAEGCVDHMPEGLATNICDLKGGSMEEDDCPIFCKGQQ